jgi:predicted ATPase
MADRITEIRIEGLRSIERLSLKLDGLTVLIGENGSGKSTILEACELLRRAADEHFLSELYEIHRAQLMLRRGSARLRLGVTVVGPLGEHPDVPMRYSLTIAAATAEIAEESLSVEYPGSAQPFIVFQRTRPNSAQIYNGTELQTRTVDPLKHLLVDTGGMFSPHPAIARVRAALASIEVHLPFEVLPAWAAQAHRRDSAARGAVLVRPATELRPLATNLANVYLTLRNAGDEHWRTTMDYVRLGLGDWVESVQTPPDPSGGSIALAVKVRGVDETLPAASLSDGQLSFLALVGLFRLDRKERALLALDEPDLHLHPRLLVRLVGMLEQLADTQPVLVATHSDRFLDALQETRGVRVCEATGPARAMQLRTLDPDALALWLADYRGLGDLRTDGKLDSVLREEPEA